MPHLHRFHVSRETPDTGFVDLSPEEAHHALRVVRVREGDPVLLFDGYGREWRGRVARATKRDVGVEAESVRRVPAPAPALTLAQAWLHRDKPLEELVRRGTELGVARFLFFRAARSEQAPRIPAKWERLAIESCKQCGRLWLPAFESRNSMDEVMGENAPDRVIAFADHAAAPLADGLTGQDAIVVVGPEGDFTEEEVGLARRNGFQTVSLGDAILRSEAAAITLVTLVRYHMGALGPLPGC